MAIRSNVVTYKAPDTLMAELLPRVDERDGRSTRASVSMIARRDLERYYGLLGRALDSVMLTEPEALLLCDALNGSVRDETLARYLPHEIEDTAPDGLAEKWGADLAALVAKARQWTALQRMAVVDAVDRWWLRQDPAEDNAARLRAVGLVH